MKWLIIGLGSMGKRRIRCLKTLGYNDITGFDPRSDRRLEAGEKYKVRTIENIDQCNIGSFDAAVVSTPPDMHYRFVEEAIFNKIPCFVEANVIIGDVEKLISGLRVSRSFVAPSCTLVFHPLIRLIKQIVSSGKYGAVTDFTYHCGQYLPDWHPWESIMDYYVSNRKTGGAREIVPFELTWITDIFGYPEDIKGFFGETLKLEAKIENVYSFIMKFSHFFGSVMVDVVSRFATRSLILNFEGAQLRWNWEDNNIRVFDARTGTWEVLEGIHGLSEVGYNRNIIEEMYISEIQSFIQGITDYGTFPNNLENDSKVLGLLNKIEESDGGFYR